MSTQKFRIKTIPTPYVDANGKLSVRDSIYVEGVQFRSSFNGVLEIPDNVEKIAGDAFWGKTQIVKVIIPSSVTTIGLGAFGECSQLEEVQFPKDGKPITIMSKAFCGCNKLQDLHVSQDTVIYGNLGICLNSITGLGKNYYTDGVALYDSSKRRLIWAYGKVSEYSIPKGVQIIGEWAFTNNGFIKKLTLPETISCIQNFAFYNCSSLEQVVIPKSVNESGNECFKKCTGLKEAAFEAENLELACGCFSCCSSLKKISFPKKCKTIPSGCFEYCSSLEINGLSIPEGITTIGADAFRNCAFKSVDFPESLEIIEDHAFYECEEIKSLILPDSVKKVGNGCFLSCNNLAEVSVKSRDIISENNENVTRNTFNENVKIVVRSH